MSNPHANHQGEPGDTGTGGSGFSFAQPQRSRMYDVLRGLGAAAIRTQKITDHETARAAQNECLREIEALVSEALAESNLDLRVDAQVWTAARDLSEEQRAQPDWLWHAGGKAASCYGRWPKGNPHMAPYVRADIALGIRAALASAPTPPDRVGEEVEFDPSDLMRRRAQISFTCAARRQGSAGGNDPADCDWPVCGCDPYSDKVIAALEEAGKLVASTGSGEETKGATPMGSGWSSSTEPKVSALTGDHPSRGEVDFDELNRLFALMPEGPWQDMRSTGGHEIRQIDTDPANKHHWPFRLCQSISGQRAACDDAVFAFIAGVLNAWPSIAAANSDDAFIERTLAMPEDELRKRFLIDGKCPEQAADIARQSFRIAELKVALTQIRSQYVVNRHDMTDAEALEAIKKIADRALGTEAEGSLVHEGPAPQGATP